MRMEQFYDHHFKGTPPADWIVHGVSFIAKERR